MAHLSKIFSKTPVDIPNRSGFDMSFENLLTMKVGTLTPVLCEECIPNETYNLGHVSQIQLPPMATNFYGRIDLRFEAFFVPMRILWQGWQNFWTMPENNPYGNPVIRPSKVPSASIEDGSLMSRGSLLDYLGFKGPERVTTNLYSIPNILPVVAYHKIWDDWYRAPKIQKPAFVNRASASPIVSALPWLSDSLNFSPGLFQLLADGVSMWSLRQRNWAKDYFTTCALYPQASGDVNGASVEIPVADTKAYMTIGALRAANTLQRWLERNNIAGERYSDQIKAQYGVMPSDAVLDRPIFLGSDVLGIYNKSVYTQAQTDNTSNNPFIGSVGSSGASAAGFKDGQLVDNFRTTEHGYLMVLASIVPHAYYSTGVRRQLYHSKVGDFAIPLLQGLGEQAVYVGELSISEGSSEYNKDIFGYQQQYSEYKYHDDEVHGLLVDGQSLAAFALQRSFDGSNPPVLGSSFLEIPTDYLDQVTAVSATTSDYGAWLDCYLSLKKVSPLSEYVIPTLGDLRDTHKEDIPYRGRYL